MFPITSRPDALDGQHLAGPTVPRVVRVGDDVAVARGHIPGGRLPVGSLRLVVASIRSHVITLGLTMSFIEIIHLAATAM